MGRRILPRGFEARGWQRASSEGFSARSLALCKHGALSWALTRLNEPPTRRTTVPHTVVPQHDVQLYRTRYARAAQRQQDSTCPEHDRVPAISLRLRHCPSARLANKRSRLWPHALAKGAKSGQSVSIGDECGHGEGWCCQTHGGCCCVGGLVGDPRAGKNRAILRSQPRGR